jgi:predicted transcriptional regulator
MAKAAMFTVKLESELRDAFMAEAEAVDRPASQIVREFMRDFVRRQRDARAHDAWMRAEIEQGLREADDPATVTVSNEEVEAAMDRQLAEWRERLVSSHE